MDQGQVHSGALHIVRVEAVLRGPIENRTRARTLFEETGWEVLDAQEEEYPSVRTPGGVLPIEAIRTSVYVLAIPVRRDAGRRPERWAVQGVKDLADDADLDLRPVGARMPRRQRRQEPHWFACAPRSTSSHFWVRWVFELERRLGFHDTGTMLLGSLERAERDAGKGRVRPPFPRREESHKRRHRERVGQSRLSVQKGVMLSWAAGVLGVPVALGLWWIALPAGLFWALLTWRCAVIMLPFVRRRRTTARRRRTSDGEHAQVDEVVVVYRRQRWHAGLAALATSGGLFALTALVTGISGPTTALGTHLLLAGAVFVMGGIRRLARAGGRKPFLVAALAALLPVAVPALGGVSPVLFTFYGAAFHVRTEEMDIAEVWQLVASIYVVGISAGLVLVFLAAWGYARPLLHTRTLRLLVPVVALTACMGLVLAWAVIVLDSAGSAGDEAVRQWRSGRVPDHYYGANPQPVCVTPIGPLSELPLYGHRLDPKQVYGTFGVVDGEVTLWDPVSGDIFPVPSDSVQVLLAGDGDPGDSIPRSCRT
ncbi:hypothetical protein ABT039_26175 [Streptomyces lasiicapitis]|uniref:hypothetical protein n=1 Tax=Streptomyces lasiicapitis TaxID=1923961 RepID=UPI00331FD56D